MFFVVFCEECVWVAHGLQHNIVTHGESLSEVRDNIRWLMRGHAELTPDAVRKIPQAPPEMWEKFISAVEGGRNLDEHLDGDVSQIDSYSLKLVEA